MLDGTCTARQSAAKYDYEFDNLYLPYNDVLEKARNSLRAAYEKSEVSINEKNCWNININLRRHCESSYLIRTSNRMSYL